MNMFRTSTGFRTILTLAVAAAAICLAGLPAFGAAGVQVSLASSFNADDVLRYSGAAFTAPGISWDNPTPGGSVDNWMVTQSAANQLAGGGSAVGIKRTCVVLSDFGLASND